MYTVSICDGHNASVALSQNGKVIFAISEERLTRKKLLWMALFFS